MARRVLTIACGLLLLSLWIAAFRRPSPPAIGTDRLPARAEARRTADPGPVGPIRPVAHFASGGVDTVFCESALYLIWPDVVGYGEAITHDILGAADDGFDLRYEVAKPWAGELDRIDGWPDAPFAVDETIVEPRPSLFEPGGGVFLPPLEAREAGDATAVELLMAGGFQLHTWMGGKL